MKVFLSIVVILLSQIALSNCDCVMQQDCIGMKPDDPRCQPEPRTPGREKPEILPDDVESLCPEYVAGKEACCGKVGLEKLKSNFISLESIFGTAVGGCDICVANLKKFWCHFTCHPQQKDFLSVIGFRNHTIDGKERTLLDLNFTLNEDMNCKLFQSCKKTKFAAQVPAMSNALGFTNFQGVNAYTKTAVYINILTDKEKGLKYDIHTCDEKPKDKMIDGIPIKDYCSCNSCGQLCNYTLTSSTPVLEGLSWTLIGVFYLCVIIATVGIFFAKKYCGGKQVENRENSLLGGINSRPSALSN